MEHPMKIKPKKTVVECLSCGDDISIQGNIKIGNMITCDTCDTQLEIIELNPLMVDWPYYDDDYFDEDYADEDDYEY